MGSNISGYPIRIYYKRLQLHIVYGSEKIRRKYINEWENIGRILYEWVTVLWYPNLTEDIRAIRIWDVGRNITE